jgi:hypothetical protein
MSRERKKEESDVSIRKQKTKTPSRFSRFPVKSGAEMEPRCWYRTVRASQDRRLDDIFKTLF